MLEYNGRVEAYRVYYNYIKFVQKFEYSNNTVTAATPAVNIYIQLKEIFVASSILPYYLS